MTDDILVKQTLENGDEEVAVISVGQNETALERQVGGSHYKHMPIQPIEYCQLNGLNAIESSVVKYVTRHRNKGGVKDIYKAIHMLELLKQIEYEKD